MASHILIVTVFFVTLSDVFLVSMAAEETVGDKINCVGVKTKYRPFQGEGVIWKHSFQKTFTEQEIDVVRCANENKECFGDIRSSLGVKFVCKTQTVKITIDKYNTESKEMIPQSVQIPVGCGCHLQSSIPF